MAKKVIVAGGGASGLAAAVTAAENGAKVTVLEHKDRVGKKILMTGKDKRIFPKAWIIYEGKTGWRGLSGVGAGIYRAGCAAKCL